MSGSYYSLLKPWFLWTQVCNSASKLASIVSACTIHIAHRIQQTSMVISKCYHGDTARFKAGHRSSLRVCNRRRVIKLAMSVIAPALCSAVSTSTNVLLLPQVALRPIKSPTPVHLALPWFAMQVWKNTTLKSVELCTLSIFTGKGEPANAP